MLCIVRTRHGSFWERYGRHRWLDLSELSPMQFFNHYSACWRGPFFLLVQQDNLEVRIFRKKGSLSIINWEVPLLRVGQGASQLRGGWDEGTPRAGHSFHHYLEPRWLVCHQYHRVVGWVREWDMMECCKRQCRLIVSMFMIGRWRLFCFVVWSDQWIQIATSHFNQIEVDSHLDKHPLLDDGCPCS